jgi:hypothetical protein
MIQGPTKQGIKQVNKAKAPPKPRQPKKILAGISNAVAVEAKKEILPTTNKENNKKTVKINKSGKFILDLI